MHASSIGRNSAVGGSSPQATNTTCSMPCMDRPTDNRSPASPIATSLPSEREACARQLSERVNPHTWAPRWSSLVPIAAPRKPHPTTRTPGSRPLQSLTSRPSIEICSHCVRLSRCRTRDAGEGAPAERAVGRHRLSSAALPKKLRVAACEYHDLGCHTVHCGWECVFVTAHPEPRSARAIWRRCCGDRARGVPRRATGSSPFLISSLGISRGWITRDIHP